MSMTGIRDISLIQTPPVDRMSIRTLVAQPTEEVISDAINEELARGGQVFFVHNRVQDIDERAELIQRLVPEARIAVGHGQMAPGELERVMLRFLTGEANVLVCTTIIESGLDIPNANTILINRADRFGLSQLYQLRGRVGRSSVRATCFLLVPSPRRLEGDAKERIATIQRFTELGSGFSIASQDLDIRGAGDLLGADQAGHIESVGYDTYMSMLREAVAELGALDEDAEPAASIDPELSVSVEARLPESWIPDTTERLRLYRDVAGAETVDAVYAVYQAAVDRFGRAPAAAEQLVELMALKRKAADLGLVSIGYQPSQLSLGLGESGPMDAGRLTRFLNRPGNRYRVTPEMQIIRAVTQTEWSQGLATLRESLRELENFVSTAGP
jgi:transcription-repair coupling factor (superfamily II helicase)